MNQNCTFSLNVTKTTDRCSIGEEIGTRNAHAGAIPVLSCEGACIRGEIARLAANRVAQAPGFRRACHGELFTVPGSTMATWVRNADHVVVIDGCHLRCHARVVEQLVAPDRLRSFNAATEHRRFHDVFEADAVPEAECHAAADVVTAAVLRHLQTTATPAESTAGCCADSATTQSTNDGCSTESGCRTEPAPRTSFTPQVAHLVGIGAAIAANCEPCLEHHVRAAERCGVSRADMHRAVTLATQVKDAPHRKVLATAEQLTGPGQSDQPRAAASGACGQPDPGVRAT